MKIRIVAGTFGHVEGGRVHAVRAGDPPIEVDEVIAARLLAAGVAEAVDEAPKQAEPVQIEAEDEGEGEDAFPEYSMQMKRAELEAVARSVGFDQDEVKAAETKADLVAMLDEAKAEYEADGDAPSFDPAGDML